MPGLTLRLSSYHRSPHELAYTAQIGGRAITTRFLYDSIDFVDLERRHGEELLRRIYFHAIAFDLNRLTSLRPDSVDFGPLADCATVEFAALWQAVLDGVWAQWRYENDLPSYRGPELLGERAPTSQGVRVGGEGGGTSRSLVFCGGGKDSLLAAKLFEEIDEPFHSFAYSHSIYGEAVAQHALIDGLLDRCAPLDRHRLRVLDGLADAPIDLAEFDVRTAAAAETPASLFLALPLALAHGLDHLVLAHERSADSGNLVWNGREINHQWGKSLEAEELLAVYVERHLLADVRYFSVLKSLHDSVVFHALRPWSDALAATHSCNEQKPWCRRCAKCVYVFLGFAAYLPRDAVERTFRENLFDVEENLGWFSRLLGLDGHLPFECVGLLEESRLAFHLAARRGWVGTALERLASEVAAPDGETLERLFETESGPHRIPTSLVGRLGPRFALLGTDARRFVERHLP